MKISGYLFKLEPADATGYRTVVEQFIRRPVVPNIRFSHNTHISTIPIRMQNPRYALISLGIVLQCLSVPSKHWVAYRLVSAVNTPSVFHALSSPLSSTTPFSPSPSPSAPSSSPPGPPFPNRTLGCSVPSVLRGPRLSKSRSSRRRVCLTYLEYSNSNYRRSQYSMQIDNSSKRTSEGSMTSDQEISLHSLPLEAWSIS